MAASSSNYSAGAGRPTPSRWAVKRPPSATSDWLDQGLTVSQPEFRRDLGLCLARLAVAYAVNAGGRGTIAGRRVRDQARRSAGHALSDRPRARRQERQIGPRG